jgi:hypothetical protein
MSSRTQPVVGCRAAPFMASPEDRANQSTHTDLIPVGLGDRVQETAAIAAQIRSDVSGVSMWVMPVGASASMTAL